MQKKRVTIIEVAADAGVSHMTVSRYFNAPEKLSKKTRDRVQRAVKQHNYIQNLAAQAFFRRKSLCLALIVPNIINPYMTAIARGAEDASREAGYSLFLCNSDDDSVKEREYVIALAGRQVDGIGLFPTAVNEEANNTISIIDDLSIPLVLIVNAPDSAKKDVVTVNSYTGGASMGRELGERGFKDVLIVGGPMENPSIRDRVEGLENALAKYPIKTRFLPGTFLEDAGMAAVEHVQNADQWPEVFVATTNTIGLGILKGLKARNRTIGVTSFDTTSAELRGLYEPFFLVAQSDGYDIGYQAMIRVIERIKNPSEPPRTTVLDIRLDDWRSGASYEKSNASKLAGKK